MTATILKNICPANYEAFILEQSRVFSEKKKFFLITGIILACFGILGSIPLVCIHAIYINILFLSLSIALLVFSIFLISVLTRILITIKETKRITLESLAQINTVHDQKQTIIFVDSLENQ